MAASSVSSSALFAANHKQNPSSTTTLTKSLKLSLSSKSSITPTLSLLSHTNRHLTHISLSVVVPRRSTVVDVATSLDAKPTILVAKKLGEAGLVLLKTFANVDCSYNLSPEELCTKISLCDTLIVRSRTKVTHEVFEASGGRLKVVGKAGVGIDNVDLAVATEHGCLVVNALTANTIAASEHEIALLTAVGRNVAQVDVSIKAREWKRNKYVGGSLVGKTLVVLGFGKVGSEVARRAKELGMHIVAHDSYAPTDHARSIIVELVSFEDVLAKADFISLHMPFHEEHHHAHGGHGSCSHSHSNSNQGLYGEYLCK